MKFPEFPALYLAGDRQTALAEKLGIAPSEAKTFTAFDLALRTEGSTSSVVVGGHLETVVDLRSADRLQSFVDIIGAFKVPAELHRRAAQIGLPTPTVVLSVDDLFRVLVQPHWRDFPAIFDVPATPQIFGQEVHAAGIEAILYPSSKTEILCAAIFPDNLGPHSYVELVGAAPPGVIRRLDPTNWRELT